MLTTYDTKYTDIYTKCSYIVNPSDICNCNNDYYFSDSDTCDCPSDPRVKWIGINARIAQNPINTNPIDSIYIIRIFDSDIYESGVNDSELFCDGNLTSEFVIQNSISYDSDKTYVGYLKKYLFGTCSRPVDIKDYSYGFSGKVAKSEYVKGLLSISQRIVNNYDKKKEDPKNTENAHIGRPVKKNMYKFRKGNK